MNLSEFIENNWASTIREVKKDSGTLIGLPYPFTIPSINDYFQEMYYWDTYFTSVGLIAGGLVAQAKNNCNNLKYLADRYGFIPNASRTYYLTRSQPPYFAFAVKDLEKEYAPYELKDFYFSVANEYEWWQKNRSTDTGLNRYGDNGVSDRLYAESAEYAKQRIKVPENVNETELGKDHFAVCESGWDCSPRFGKVIGCKDSLPIDLNSNLYFYETYLASLQSLLGINDGIDWAERAEKRKKAIDCLMWNTEKEMYYDYNFVTKKQSEVISCAAFHPYFVKMADKNKTQGLENAYDALMKPYGLACTDRDYGHYQWSYPNGWAPLQYIAYIALKNYDMTDKAESVAGKYVKLLEKVYENTGTTFEKYNVADGNDRTLDENSDHHTMMGWTTGVYVYFKKELEKND